MLFPDTYNVYVKFLNDEESNFSLVATLSSNALDCILNASIPRNFVSDIRRNFQLHVDEEILMFRDTSFWNDKNQGAVVTDWGITVIPDNENSDDIHQISWENVHHVEERGDQLIFFLSEDRNNNIPVHLSYIFKESNDYMWADAIAELFTAMADSQQKVSQEDAESLALTKYDELLKAGKTDDALQVLLQYRNDFNTVGITDIICDHLNKQGDFSRSLRIIAEDIQALNDEQMFYKSYLTWQEVNIYISQETARLRGLDKSGKMLEQAQGNNFDYILAQHRELCFFVAQNAPDDLIYNTTEKGIILKEDSTKDFGYAENYLREHFLERPYKDRKLIVPVNDYTLLGQQTLTAINIDSLANINFPMGHPVANHLYVGHPLIPSRYIPFENYELELIEDRVREFSMLAQALGATSITIECVNTNDSKETRHSHTDVKGNVDYCLASASGTYSGDVNAKFISEISKKFNLHQEFSPKDMPHVPDGLVWYSNEPSWQRLVEQRKKGSLNVHVERIESRTSQVVENSELKKVSAEVESLFVAANGSWEKSMEQMFETHENAVLAIHVVFAPIESLGKTNSIHENVNTNLSQAEQEYMEELKECLNNDGVISDGERRLLNRFRQRLGISEERANELEESLKKPKLLLSPDEQEYLNEFKDALSDGEITPRSRRLLDKLRSSMGISPERATEIENSI